jgi:hypothetical protein
LNIYSTFAFIATPKKIMNLVPKTLYGKHLLLCLFLSTIFLPTQAQKHTIGLIQADNAKAFKGYNLIYPSEQSTVYLLDNCGRVVHTWTDSAHFRPGNSVFLLENGVLLKTKRHSSVTADFINGPGSGATVEKRDWNNNLIWTFTLNDSFSRLHHDITPMPNGNVLMISWDNRTRDEAIAVGRNPATISVGRIWPEKIIEVKPIGLDSFSIVWEWKEWDHLIQDFDSTKPGYGNISEHPEKVNINWGTLGGSGGSAWTFLNSIDYDEERDQILLSTRFFNEIWILDHSTTTAEAAGSAGGNSNRGGDLLFRWGNPRAYNAGIAADQKTFSQHTARWLSHNPSDSNFGKVMLFNNMSGPNYSTVDIVKPVFDGSTKQYLKSGKTFLPANFDWTYKREDSTPMYSTGFGGAQLLPNGNTLICSGRQGNTFEITPEKEIVWEYIVPINFGIRAKQGDSIPIANNSTFRAERFPLDFPPFAGKDLSPKGFIELEPDTFFCEIPNSVRKINKAENLVVYPNPASGSLHVTMKEKTTTITTLTLSSITGKAIITMDHITGNTAELNISNVPSGLYLLSVNGNKSVQKIQIQN